MNGSSEFRGKADDNLAPLSEEELRAQEAEPLPIREAMSTLIWAPGPASIAPEVDGIVGDESL